MNFNLRDYQEQGKDFLLSRKTGAGIFFDTGLGKSRTSIAALIEKDAKDVLIICPMVVSYHWIREVKKLFPDIADDQFYVMLGTKDDKEKILGNYCSYRFSNPDKIRFLITNYHSLKILAQHRTLQINERSGRVVNRSIYWDVRILDECHHIKNYQSQMFKNTKKIRTRSNFFLSGTPTSQGPRDVWTYLNILDPDAFPSFWAFVEEHCFVDRTTNRGTIIGGPRNPKELKKVLAPYFLRKRKKDMGAGRTRDFIEVEPHPEQRKLYDELYENLMAETLDDELLLLPNGATLALRVRQLLLAPALLRLPGRSATLDAVSELVTSINAPTVIFTPFKEAFKYIEEVLPRESVPCYKIHGGMGGLKLDETVQSYERNKSKHKVLIATIQLSQGYEILTASHAIFAGADWSNITNLQAEGRLDRLSQKEHVNCYYIVNRGTIEEDVLATVDQKVKWDSQIA